MSILRIPERVLWFFSFVLNGPFFTMRRVSWPFFFRYCFLTFLFPILLHLSFSPHETARIFDSHFFLPQLLDINGFFDGWLRLPRSEPSPLFLPFPLFFPARHLTVSRFPVFVFMFLFALLVATLRCCFSRPLLQGQARFSLTPPPIFLCLFTGWKWRFKVLPFPPNDYLFFEPLPFAIHLAFSSVSVVLNHFIFYWPLSVFLVLISFFPAFFLL